MSDPVFHYGDETIELSQIAKAMKSMFTHTFEHATVIQEALGSHLVLREKLQTWRACWVREDIGRDPFFKFIAHDGARIQLVDILRQSHHMKASNPLDKVYGMHGICQWLDIYLPTPRYDHALEDAFFEVTRAAIEGYDDMSVLYDVDGPDRNPGLPSWVPDWANGWKRLYGRPMMPTENFKAGGPKALYRIDSGERLLKFKGKFVDEIDKVGSRITVNEDMSVFAAFQSDWFRYEGVAEESWEAWQVFCEWVSLVHEGHSQSSISMDDLYQTLVDPQSVPGQRKDSSNDVFFGPGKLEAAFFRWYQALMKTNEEVARATPNCKELTRRLWFSKCVFGEASDKDVRAIHFNIWVRTRGKCLLVTKLGRLGLGTGPVSAGHKVCVAAGLGMPLIFQPAGGRYRLIGYAYLHGVMYGECWPAASEELITISVE